MVKKYFRGFIYPVVASMSLAMGMGSVAQSYITAYAAESVEESVTEAEEISDVENSDAQAQMQAEQIEEQGSEEYEPESQEEQTDPAADVEVSDAQTQMQAEPDPEQEQGQEGQGQEGQGQEGQGQEGQGQEGQGQEGQGQEGQGQEGQGQEGQGQEGQGQEGQGQEGQGQEGQGQEGQGQEGQGQEGQGQEGQGQEGQGQEGQGQEGQGGEGQGGEQDPEGGEGQGGEQDPEGGEGQGDQDPEVAEPNDVGAVLAYQRSKYNVGDKVSTRISGLVSNNAQQISIEYQIPSNAVFSEMKTLPKFSNVGSVLVEYRNEAGTWAEYNSSVEPITVKALRVSGQAVESQKEIKQTLALEFDLKTTKTGTASSEMVSTFTRGENVSQSVASASFQVDLTEAVSIEMSQDPEALSRIDEATQKVSVTLNAETSLEVKYEIDAALTAKAVNIEEGDYLIGSNAVIVSKEGETLIPVTGPIDLSSYTNVKSITFKSDKTAPIGTVSSFEVIVVAKKDESSAICKATATASAGEAKETVSKTYKTKINEASIEKPFIKYAGGKVAFGDNFMIEYGGINMPSSSVEGNYTYEILVPEFVTTNSILIPSIAGAKSIEVFATIGGEEKSIGEVAPGKAIDIASKDVSKIRILVTPEENYVTCSDTGVVTFTNNNETNKVNYFGFRSSGKVEYKSITYTKASDILGVTLELSSEANKPEPQPQSNSVDPAPTPGDNGGGNGGGGGSETPEPQTEAETPSPEAERIKAAEKEKKDQIKASALQKEQELKDRQKTLLEERLNSIRNNVSDSVGSSASGTAGSSSAATSSTTTTKTPVAATKYAAWEVRPIYESLIGDPVRKLPSPISEKIIENPVPNA